MRNLVLNQICIIKKAKKFLLIIFILQTTCFFGQDLSYIYGKVVDSKTGAPLAFASIVQKDKTVGLISNDDGSFKIPKYFAVANATLVVSFIGYYSEEIQVADLNQNGLNIIKLIEKTEILDEIVIGNKPRPQTDLTVHEIVKRAIESIKSNYPLNEFSYVGYYRDYQKDSNEDYVNLNEAILKVHDLGFGFQDHFSSKIKLFTYSKNLEFPVNEAASQPYDYQNKTKIIDKARLGYLSENANEFVLLRIHDAIRNYNINTYDYVNRLEIDFLRNHNFFLVKETSIDDVSLYEIKFGRNFEKSFAEGRIFISKSDYKIYKLRYSVYEKKSRRDIPIAQTSQSIAIKEKLIFNVVVEYANYNQMMYPKYISFNNPFEVLLPPKFFPTDAKFGHIPYGSDNVLLYIDLIFNNEINPKKADKKRNYRLGYQGVKIDIDSIRVMKNVARVYPKDEDVIFPKKALLNGMKLSGKDFSLEVKNIEDVDGNVVFEGKKESFVQYREFFIQELNFDPKQEKDSLYMIKNLPLSRNQPISAPKNLSKYWMNTPLKN